MGKIVAVVGMAGSGKSTVADMFREQGFGYLRFGQITLDMVQERGLKINEENERRVREELRHRYGMAAYAKLNVNRIEELKKEGNVIVDGLYSWEEYLELKSIFGDEIIVLSIYSSPKTRYNRLANRKHDPKKDPEARFRSTNHKESSERDHAEIEKLHKAGPIAMADITIINESSYQDLVKAVNEFIRMIS